MAWGTEELLKVGVTSNAARRSGSGTGSAVSDSGSAVVLGGVSRLLVKVKVVVQSGVSPSHHPEMSTAAAATCGEASWDVRSPVAARACS